MMQISKTFTSCLLAMEESVTNGNDFASYKKCVVEFQGFRDNQDKFIIKELAIFDTSTYVVNYFLFKPPFPFQKLNNKSARCNTWLTKNLHYIRWNEGFTQYKELNNIMRHYCQQYDEIYTSGDEKSRWIKKYCTSKVIDIPLNKDFGTDLNGLCIGVKCLKHKTGNCALSRAYRIGRLVSSGGGSA